MWHYLLVTLFLASFSFTVADEVSDALSATPTASISAGRIIGTTTAILSSVTGPSIPVNKFLGIPYAAPPTNQNRFRPPQPPAPWSTARDAKQFSASCPQVFVRSPVSNPDFTRAVFNNPAPVESEDCLYINVFAPKKAWDPARPPYPVLYWMYGGAWQFGNAGQPWYDGSHFAALEDVIVVSVNYRTNAFGLPMAPTINLTERNLAVLDQRAGLQWVQDNIRHFGGDPSRVTIFGQSAGAYAVDLLITSYAPNVPRPFRAGIMQSGVSAYLPIPICSDGGYYSWNALAAELNCMGTDQQKFSCIQSAPWQDVVAAQARNWTIGFGHACDNVTVVSDPRTRLEAGNVANVPVIIGSNTADGSFYSIVFGLNVTAYFQTYLTAIPGIRERALAEYPIGAEGRINEQSQLQQIHTDWFFHCPAVWYANTYTARNPAYRYLFNATFDNTRAQWPLWPTSPIDYQGAYHTSEIPIVFTSYKKSTEETGEGALSDLMRKAWANFAKDPTKPPLSDWPRVTPSDGDADVMGFGTDGKGGHGVVEDRHHCRFWEREGLRNVHA